MAEYVYPQDQTVQDGQQTMRHDLEMKLANARNEEERHMYMRMMDALNG